MNFKSSVQYQLWCSFTLFSPEKCLLAAHSCHHSCHFRFIWLESSHLISLALSLSLSFILVLGILLTSVTWIVDWQWKNLLLLPPLLTEAKKLWGVAKGSFPLFFSLSLPWSRTQFSVQFDCEGEREVSSNTDQQRGFSILDPARQPASQPTSQSVWRQLTVLVIRLLAVYQWKREEYLFFLLL